MMNPSDVYERLLAELATGELSALQRQVFDLLRANPDGLERRDLVFHIYGFRPVILDGNKEDRKIRKAIEHLRRRLFPIVSTSGKPGYRLDVSREAVRKMVAELRSRKEKLEEQIEAALKFYDMPTTYVTDPQDVEQMVFSM